MRKVINSTYITINGEVEDPHLWLSSADSQGQAHAIQTDLLENCDALLMGRRTDDAFEAEAKMKVEDGPLLTHLLATSRS